LESKSLPSETLILETLSPAFRPNWADCAFKIKFAHKIVVAIKKNFFIFMILNDPFHYPGHTKGCSKKSCQTIN
jgi:hypothetical protein